MLDLLSIKSQKGELSLNLAKQLLQNQEWGLARIEIELAMRKGGVENVDSAGKLYDETCIRMGVKAVRPRDIGDNVCVYNDNGSIVTGVEINDDLRAGAVAMSHGYGGLDAKVMKVASRKPGANCNRLMPVGPGSYEPLSHMSWMSGVPVRIEKVV